MKRINCRWTDYGDVLVWDGSFSSKHFLHDKFDYFRFNSKAFVCLDEIDYIGAMGAYVAPDKLYTRAGMSSTKERKPFRIIVNDIMILNQWPKRL